MSPLEKERIKYTPTLPKILQNPNKIVFKKSKEGFPKKDQEKIKQHFAKTYGQSYYELQKTEEKKNSSALRIGVVFSGGQAAGGHNVIAGLFDAMVSINPQSILLGFLSGPSGIINNQKIPITKESLASYRNTGGFDLIGSGRTKIETEKQLSSSLQTAKDLSLDGIVIIGGDDSNTNAAILAEYFMQKNSKTCVVGVPKTIDGDLRSEDVEITFGFDTACKIYSELIGNLQRDALSAKKYYHFIKLMGRSASHISLECALKTQPNYTIIGEESEHNKETLSHIVKTLADIVEKRAEKKKNYGVFLIPEGLIEFIPEMRHLIDELNTLLAKHTDEIDHLKTFDEKKQVLLKYLSVQVQKTYCNLPQEIQKQLILERDPHGNVPVSLIETEKLLSLAVKEELTKRKNYTGKFNALHHFYGYEGRCGFPSNFDAQYCYALGYVAAILLSHNLTGYMSCINHLTALVEDWTAMGVPLTSLMHMEIRKGKEKPVIKKTLVDIHKKNFKDFIVNRKKWALEDMYLFPGPIQFYGDKRLTDSRPLIL